MRQERTIQMSTFDLYARHEIGRELKTMSQCLDEHPALVGLVDNDLRRHGVKETGRQGLPAESALRCGLLNHRNILITKSEPEFFVVTFADRAYRCRSARSSGRKRYGIATQLGGTNRDRER